MPDELESSIVLQLLPALGAAAAADLLARYGSFSAILRVDPTHLAAKYRSSMLRYHAMQTDYLSRARSILDQCAADDITVLNCLDSSYPALLREIEKPPTVLYIKGHTDALAMPQIAIVGSRQHTGTGEANARAFAATLAASGFTVTSGMALGIDAAAHQGALQSGSTVAVLGTGIDVIYPRRHEELYCNIATSGGAIVSEFLPGTPARASHFPQRNRIISGLSLGVLVVEAALRSGSLITARHAMRQGREVFAIPGSIHNPVAQGCHHLIREGATLVQTAQDIVDELGGMLSYASKDLPARTAADDLNAEESTVLSGLGYDPVDLDTLLDRCPLSTAQMTGVLTRLELKGLIEQQAGRYSRIT